MTGMKQTTLADILYKKQKLISLELRVRNKVGHITKRLVHWKVHWKIPSDVLY